MPSLDLRYRAARPEEILADPHGERIPWSPAHSFTYNFLEWLRAQSMGLTANLTDINAVNRSILPANARMTGTAGSNDDDHGIIIGDGGFSVGLNYHRLNQRIPSQTSGGILYGAGPTWAYSINEANRQLVTISRTFGNDTTADVVVSEIGLYVDIDGNPFMVIYDWLIAPIVLPAGLGTTLQYQLVSGLNA